MNKLWTPANIVTCIRVVALPFWLALAEYVIAAHLQGTGVGAFAALFFILIALTDKLDGYLARSRGEVTNFGKFLDPIADKLVVVVALAYVLEQGQGAYFGGIWALLIIITREFLVSGLRMVTAEAGVVIAASSLGKAKTALTLVGLCILLVHVLWFELPLFVIAGSAVMVVALLLTLYSGVDYFVKAWPALRSHAEV